MNMTDCDCESIDQKEMCIDYIISLASIGSLFLVSEILPFLKSQKGNGLVDILICCFEGSDCCLTKLIECLKGEVAVDEKGQNQEQKQEQKQSIKTDEEQHLTNSVNINIQK